MFFSKRFYSVFLLILIIGADLFSQKIIGSTKNTVHSPNGDFVFVFYQKFLPDSTKQIYYQITFKGHPIILESELGLLVGNQLFESALAIPNDPSRLWCENLNFVRVSHDTVQRTWKPLYGERNIVTDHFNQMIIDLEKNGEKEVAEHRHTADKHALKYDRRRNYKMSLEVRAYNEGVAFRYFIPENTNGLFVHITGEQTQFSLPEGTLAYYERWAQGPYLLLPLKDWPDECERPLTLKLPDGLTVALLEAEMIDYSRGKFKLSYKKTNTLQLSMYDCADVITPFGTPWRVVMAADKPGKLIENNDLVLNLNPDNRIADTQWIKPGKVIRDVTCSMEGAMACVDFAAARNSQYVHLDAGWYGPEMKVSSDASRVAVNKNIDMQKLVNYAKSKGIGIFVYVNQRALANQIDSIFPLYQKWGIKGVKFGFVQVGSNKWTSWVHEAVRKAAKYQLMVDIHDEYRPTGFSRTYPNLLTQEGIRGNEEMPDATHNCVLPFTRFLAGAGDYTISYNSPRIKNTHAHQLALAAIYYSPLQFIYWYDKPADVVNQPEIEFFDKVKTVWDDTRVLSGEIGGHIAIARKEGEDWFVGAITNNQPRQYSIPLGFLDKGKKYVAHVYVDDDTVNTKTKVAIHRFMVESGSTLSFQFKASGGAAVHIEPAKEGTKYKALPKSKVF